MGNKKSKKLKWLVGLPVGMILILVILSSIGGGMTQLNHEISIQAPTDKVFAVLSDLEAVQHYNPGVKKATYISDNREGAGAARVCDLGKDGQVKERVVDWRPGESITMELYESPWPIEFMKWKTVVKSTGDGTLLSQTLDYQMKFGLLGSLMDRLMMRNKMDKTLSQVFGSLKNYVEAQ